MPASGPGFVGRSRELAVLSEAFASALAGEAKLVLLTGEPGIGKTELARAFGRQARADGALVLWGGAWEDGGAPPYWPWAQILRSYGRQAGPQALARAAGQDTAVLAPVLPELGSATDRAGLGEAARFALFEGVCAALDRASAVSPLMVVLDDLHAAGRPSALLLRFAAAAGLSRILLVATYRGAEAHLDREITDVITALETTGTYLSLAGLAADEIRAMLPGAGAEVVSAVQRRSGGNPLFISQVTRLLGREAADVDEVPVPPGIRQAIRRHLDRLAGAGVLSARDVPGGTGAAREILAAAAVLGHAPDPGLVAAVLGSATAPVAAVFDAAVQAGLLHAAQPPAAAYRFAHPLIRETLREELAPAARAGTHRRIAAALEREPWRSRAGNAQLAYHFLRAGSAGGTVPAAAVDYARLAGDDALNALAYEEAAGHFRQALHALGLAPSSTLPRRCELLLRLATALGSAGAAGESARVVDEAAALAREAGQPRLLAAAALMTAQHLDFNAPAGPVIALLREAVEALGPDDHALRARVLARLAIAVSPDPAAARSTADQAVESARLAAARPASPGPEDSYGGQGAALQAGDGGREAAAALAVSLLARQHVLWGTRRPQDALAGADAIVAAARRAAEPQAELDGHVLRLTHLLELGDGPACHRVLPELDRIADAMRQPAPRLIALSRRSTLAALTGDFGQAASCARQAWETGQAAGLPDAGAVYWGQLFAIWIHAGLPASDEQWMEQQLRDLVARSHLSVAHASALIQLEAAHGATEQASGLLDQLVTDGMNDLRPDMLYVWALALLARACRLLGAAPYAVRVYEALVPYRGRVAVAAGAVMCAGSTDFYLAGLAALSGDTAAADEHYRAAASCHRRLGARPMLATTLYEHALLLRHIPGAADTASAALAEAKAIAASCGMTRLLAVLERQHEHAPDSLTLTKEDGYWLLAYGSTLARLTDSLGLRYLHLLVSNPGQEIAAVKLAQLASPAQPAATAAQAEGLHEVSGTGSDEILDPRARQEYRHRLTELEADLAEAEQWHDTERSSRLRAEKDFLIRELTAAAGLGGRPRRLGSEAERARLNVTRAIRSAISRIRDHAPDAAAHLDQTIRTGARCSYIHARTGPA